jgi:hypothetical protein
MSNATEACGACGWRSVPLRPSIVWRVANLTIWVVTMLLVFGSSLIGPAIMIILPLLLVAGSALGYTADRATREPLCPHCERVMRPAAPGAPPRDIHLPEGSSSAHA